MESPSADTDGSVAVAAIAARWHSGLPPSDGGHCQALCLLSQSGVCVYVCVRVVWASSQSAGWQSPLTQLRWEDHAALENTEEALWASCAPGQRVHCLYTPFPNQAQDDKFLV